MLGYILLVIPGIIWTLKYQFVPYLVADKEMDAKEAFEYSARMTDGWKMKLFFYGIGLMLVNLAGALLFGIGLIITIPITYLFSFVIYRALDKRLRASTKTKKAAT